MSDRFLTTIITDIAILKAKIESISKGFVRDSLEREYNAKYEKIKNAIPERLKHRIDEMILEEMRKHRYRSNLD